MAVIRVPLDQTTIQAGVDAAKPGDVILVLKGIYKETVIVNRSFIRIVADDKNGAILEGGGLLTDGFLLYNVNDVEISGFKIQNYMLNGISVYDGGYHRLIENQCDSNGLNGIGLTSNCNFVWKNMLWRNSYAGAAIDANDNWLIDNQIAGNGADGVMILSGSHNALISNNVLRSVNHAGFSILGTNPLLFENELKYNLQGIVIYNETDIINSGIGDYNETANNKSGNIVIGSDSTAVMNPYLNFMKERLESAEQSLDQVPERQRSAQEKSLTVSKQYLSKLQLYNGEV